MKYHFTLPATALFAVTILAVLVHYGVIPPGIELLEDLKDAFDEYFYLLIFTIILLESIVYVGFYFPGQFFAVVLVIVSEPKAEDIIYLTIAMVLAATVGSAINFMIGRASVNKSEAHSKINLKTLLIAMIHINSLAFFMLAQGANQKAFKVVLLAGLLNFPYYLVLIATTALLSEEIMQVAESTWLLASIIGVWLCVALILDIKARKSKSLQN